MPTNQLPMQGIRRPPYSGVQAADLVCVECLTGNTKHCWPEWLFQQLRLPIKLCRSTSFH
jgi:hypothetical protein